MVVPIILAHAGVPAVWKPIHHLSDFLAGIAAAGLYETAWHKVPALRRRGYLLYVPAVAAAIAFIAHPEVLRGTLADLNTVLRPLNVALLIGLAFGDGFLARFLAMKPVEYLGKVSYSMYILHVPVLWWFSRYALHLIGPAPTSGTRSHFSPASSPSRSRRSNWWKLRPTTGFATGLWRARSASPRPRPTD